MLGKFTSVLIVGFIILYESKPCGAKYPDGLSNATTCEEFGRTARFNPYSVLDVDWFVFYYWGPTSSPTSLRFEYPTVKAKAFLHHILDEHVSLPINWTARFMVMHNLNNNMTSLMVERGDRGLYWKYSVTVRRTKKQPLMVPMEVLFKQFDGGKYIAYMECKKEIVLLLSKKEDIPRQKFLQDVAAKAGFRSRGGRSYLYQGHKWLPMPEENEEVFWMGQKAIDREKKVLELMKVEADKKLAEKKKENAPKPAEKPADT